MIRLIPSFISYYRIRTYIVPNWGCLNQLDEIRYTIQQHYIDQILYCLKVDPQNPGLPVRQLNINPIIFIFFYVKELIINIHPLPEK